MPNIGDDGELDFSGIDEKRKNEENQRRHEIELERIRGRTQIAVALIALVGVIFAAVVPVIPVPSSSGEERQSIISAIFVSILNNNSNPRESSTEVVSAPTIIIEPTVPIVATDTPDIRGTLIAEFTATALAQPTNTATATDTLLPPTLTNTPTPQSVGLPFFDNFSNNQNGWSISSSSVGAASLANGQLNIIAYPNQFLPFQIEIPQVRANRFFVEADVVTTQNPQSSSCDSFQYVGYALGNPQVEQYIFVVVLQWTSPSGLTGQCFDRKWYAKIFRVQDGEVEFYRLHLSGEEQSRSFIFERELSQNETWQSDVPFRLGFERDENDLVSIFINGRRVLSQTIAPENIENRISLVVWAPRTFRETRYNSNASAYFDNLSVEETKPN